MQQQDQWVLSFSISPLGGRVVLYNDEIHTFDEVILQLIKATGCSTSQAERFAWQVHTEGKAAVFEGTFEECFRVQGVLREIQLVTEIEG